MNTVSVPLGCYNKHTTGWEISHRSDGCRVQDQGAGRSRVWLESLPGFQIVGSQGGEGALVFMSSIHEGSTLIL